MRVRESGKLFGHGCAIGCNFFFLFSVMHGKLYLFDIMMYHDYEAL